MHAELHDKSGHDAEEAAFVEIAHANQLVEAVDAAGRPGAIGLHHEVALRSLKFHLEDFRDNHFLGRP
jgi:hypothetical protein